MKRKQLSLLLAAASLSVVCSAPAFASEPENVADSIAIESIGNVDDGSGSESEPETETEAAATEAVTEAEPQDDAGDFIEGSAVLQDYDYEKGELTVEGWTSTFLNMKYAPAEKISMGVAENDQIATYHERNGKDKQVAANEMVALDSKDGYVQLAVEVNPNRESAEDILGRFCENEGLSLVSDQNEMEIAGKNFLTCTGVSDKDRFLLGVSVDEDNFAIAVKVKYANTAARKALLDGFDVAEEVEAETEEAPEAEESGTEAETDSEEVTEASTEAETDNGLIMPEEFDAAELFEAEETELPSAE